MSDHVYFKAGSEVFRQGFGELGFAERNHGVVSEGMYALAQNQQATVDGSGLLDFSISLSNSLTSCEIYNCYRHLITLNFKDSV